MQIEVGCSCIIYTRKGEGGSKKTFSSARSGLFSGSPQIAITKEREPERVSGGSLETDAQDESERKSAMQLS